MIYVENFGFYSTHVVRVEFDFDGFLDFLILFLQFFARCNNFRALILSRLAAFVCGTEYAAPRLLDAKQFAHFIWFMIVSEVQSFVPCGKKGLRTRMFVILRGQK